MVSIYLFVYLLIYLADSLNQGNNTGWSKLCGPVGVSLTSPVIQFI